ncbi:hypothetical protein V8C86DRAFT_2519056 [Haematococcus lacustris]
MRCLTPTNPADPVSLRRLRSAPPHPHATGPLAAAAAATPPPASRPTPDPDPDLRPVASRGGDSTSFTVLPALTWAAAASLPPATSAAAGGGGQQVLLSAPPTLCSLPCHPPAPGPAPWPSRSQGSCRSAPPRGSPLHQSCTSWDSCLFTGHRRAVGEISSSSSSPSPLGVAPCCCARLLPCTPGGWVWMGGRPARPVSAAGSSNWVGSGRGRGRGRG